MPRIFHQLRKRLLAEGRVTRYLQYAVGEISLVVVGILIALSINNANEGRKVRAFEVKMLHEVRNGLVRDTALIHMLQMRLHTIDTSAARLLRAQGAPVWEEQQLNRNLTGMMTGVMLSVHRGPYDAIRAVGLDRISNDSIRTQLMDLYDYAMPRTLDMVRKEFDQLKTHREELVHALLRLAPTPEGTDLLEPHWSPAIPDLQHSPELRTLAHYRRMEATNIAARLDHLQIRILSLLRLLDRALGLEVHKE